MIRLKTLLFSLFLVVAGSLPVFAHAKIASTTPIDGAEVAAGLSKIAISFTEPMRITVVKVVRSEGLAEISASNELPKAFGKSVDIDVEPLETGDYTVNWIALSGDGHVMKGKFSFAVTAQSLDPAD